jgi:integral membrane protein
MQLLRLMALLEGSSLLVLLFIAVPLKFVYGIPEAVKLVGPIHGALFLVFNVVLMTYTSAGHLSRGKAVIGFAASFIPFGSFVYKAKVLNKR